MTRRFKSFRLLASALAVLAPCLITTHTQAQLPEGASVVRVEEDWELLVGQPDANSNGPQISCTVSPTGNTDGVHAVFELNHRSQPEFAAGGLQIQVWNGESPVASLRYPDYNQMRTTGEAVRWTQVLNLDGDTLRFAIRRGYSTTWGEFDGGNLRYETTTDLPNLNQYSPAVSIQNSGVCYASNRVQLLVLRRVRYKLASGEVFEDDSVRVAHVLN